MRVEGIQRLAAALPVPGERGYHQFENKIDARETRRIRLVGPVPVHIVYFTAWAAEDGTTPFREDIYDRDTRLLAALEESDPLIGHAQPQFSGSCIQ